MHVVVVVLVHVVVRDRCRGHLVVALLVALHAWPILRGLVPLGAV